MKRFYTPDKLDDIIKSRGKPVLKFIPKDNFSFTQRRAHDIPLECAVFRIKHPSQYIVFSRYCDKDEWHANTGERWVIKELLSAIEERKDK